MDQKMKRALLILNIIFITVGGCGGHMVTRLYFIQGGKRLWVSTFLQTSGWPIICIALFITYLHRRGKEGSKAKLFFMEGHVFMGAGLAGALTGLGDYFYSYGVARLPLLSSQLVIVSQLTFTSIFAFLLVKQKFTPYSINAVALLTIGSGILAVYASADLPKGVSKMQYYLGFLMTVVTAAVYGFILSLIELTYKKAKQAITYTMVMEIQLVLCLMATLVCAIGMIVNKDFKAIPRESREFGLGETTYYVALVCISIIWQIFFLGAVGVIFVSSSLLAGVIIAILLPITEILAIIFYKEKFTAEKGFSLVLSLWGFVSYFYGELKHSQENRKTQDSEKEMQQNITPQFYTTPP